MRMTYLCLVFIIFLPISAAAQAALLDTGAKLISAPPFEISAEDEAAGIDGIVKVVTEVNTSGDVTKALVFIGPAWPCAANLYKRVDAVMRDVEKAVLKYKYSPAIKDGKPVTGRAGLSIKIGKAARKPVESEPKVSGVPTIPKNISGGVLNGRATYLAQPSYPDDAKAAHESGSVTVQVQIDEKGKVIVAQAIEGPPLLLFAARAAACQSKFSPTLFKGDPVRVSGLITYNFVR